MTAVLRMVIGSFVIFIEIDIFNFPIVVCRRYWAQLKCSLKV